MTPELASARRELLKIADDLESISFRLRGVQASLPEPVAESDRLRDLDDMEPATELRATIACTLNDWMEPAIRDLRDAAGRRKRDPETLRPALESDHDSE